jgi:hypothetical protein
MEKLDQSVSRRIIRYTVIISTVIITIIFLALSIVVRETTYITAHPLKFMLEIAVISLLGSLPVYLVAKNRMTSMKVATKHFILVVLHFVVVWLLAELSGFNNYVFPRKQTQTHDSTSS